MVPLSELDSHELMHEMHRLEQEGGEGRLGGLAAAQAEARRLQEQLDFEALQAKYGFIDKRPGACHTLVQPPPGEQAGRKQALTPTGEAQWVQSRALASKKRWRRLRLAVVVSMPCQVPTADAPDMSGWLPLLRYSARRTRIISAQASATPAVRRVTGRLSARATRGEGRRPTGEAQSTRSSCFTSSIDAVGRQVFTTLIVRLGCVLCGRPTPHATTQARRTATAH